jgi:hypothetical protein
MWSWYSGKARLRHVKSNWDSGLEDWLAYNPFVVRYLPFMGSAKSWTLLLHTTAAFSSSLET